MIIRPGPEAIQPARAPGGIVIHVYTLAGERVLERALPTVEVAAEVAAVDAGFVIAQVGHVPVVIVTYDGDTGARIVPDETRMYL